MTVYQDVLDFSVLFYIEGCLKEERGEVAIKTLEYVLGLTGLQTVSTIRYQTKPLSFYFKTGGDHQSLHRSHFGQKTLGCTG